MGNLHRAIKGERQVPDDAPLSRERRSQGGLGDYFAVRADLLVRCLMCLDVI